VLASFLAFLSFLVAFLDAMFFSPLVGIAPMGGHVLIGKSGANVQAEGRWQIFFRMLALLWPDSRRREFSKW